MMESTGVYLVTFRYCGESTTRIVEYLMIEFRKTPSYLECYTGNLTSYQ